MEQLFNRLVLVSSPPQGDGVSTRTFKMNNKNISPKLTQSINRLHLGQLSTSVILLEPNTQADVAIRACEYGLRSEALASYDGDEE